MTIIPSEIVHFKQHTFSRACMVRIVRVLTYMHLHARDTIICLPDDKMASAEAGRFASLFKEDFDKQ